MTVAAVVLAGGRSSRFGRDKLAERIDGRTVLDLAIDAVRVVVDEVLVVAAPDVAVDVPDRVRLIHDQRAHDGPLAGVASGLEASSAEIVLVVGGDMPWMVPAVLRRMIGLAGEGPMAIVLGSGDTWRPLPLVVRREAALTSASELLSAGDRRLRSLPSALGMHVIPEDVWRADDATGQTLRDVDVPADLP